MQGAPPSQTSRTLSDYPPRWFLQHGSQPYWCLSAFLVSCRCCGNHTTPLFLFLLFPPPPMFIKNHKMYKIIKVIKNGFLQMTALIQSKSLWRKNSFSVLDIKVLMLPLPLAHPQTGVCVCTTCLHTSKCLIVY